MKKMFIPACFLALGLVVLAGYYRMRSQHELLLNVKAEQRLQLKNSKVSDKTAKALEQNP